MTEILVLAIIGWLGGLACYLNWDLEPTDRTALFMDRRLAGYNWLEGTLGIGGGLIVAAFLVRTGVVF